jgi:hypothetical protein
MKLIYHKKKKDRDKYSPFDDELKTLANGQELKLVSPYIRLKYLKELTEISKDWQLISDLNAWMLSHSIQEREKIYEFIIDIKNFDKIRHIQGIHAKVLITDNSAFLGSANFTEAGIYKKTEMSVSFSEQNEVKELTDWFDDMWESVDIINKEELEKFIEDNKDKEITKPAFSKLKTKQKRPNASHLEANNNAEIEQNKTHIKSTRNYTSRNKTLPYTKYAEIGSELVFIKDESKKCKIVDDKLVEYEGKTYTLSGLAKQLSKQRAGGTDCFMYNGIPLRKIRDEYYSKEK